MTPEPPRDKPCLTMRCITSSAGMLSCCDDVVKMMSE